MINQQCSQCGEITGPASRCECCGGDPGAAEVVCHRCDGEGSAMVTFGYAPWDVCEMPCSACLHSGRPGYVEAPYILEHDRYAKRAYWMDCPLSEIPLRAPFKELREVWPAYIDYVFTLRQPAGATPCSSCGNPAGVKKGVEGESICPNCSWMDWGQLDELGVSRRLAMFTLRPTAEWSANLWANSTLVPAGLPAGGEA